MSEILESRNVKIKGRIISLENIRRLVAILQNRYNTKKEEKKNCRISFSATCFDDSNFKSGDIGIFSDDSVLSSKRVSDISLEYISYEDNETIKVRLSHGNYEHVNYIEVCGTDSDWVNGVIRKLEEEVSAFQPQNEFLTEYKKLLEFIFALSIGSVYFFIIDAIPSDPIDAEPPKWLVQLATAIKNSLILGYGIKYAFSYFLGICPAYFLMDKLKSLWPSVEFQIGPEHTFIEKRRRAWILSAFLIGIVPLITSLVYDILKVLFAN